jgi:aryl sulfotransferase
MLVSHCTFEYMKAHGDKAAPLGGAMWDGGAASFIFKGTNGRWRDMLTKEDVEAYESRALKELGPECADWLATGEMSARG